MAAKYFSDASQPGCKVLYLLLQINWKEVESVASQPTEQHVFTVESFNDLGNTLVQRLVLSTCKVQGNEIGGKGEDKIQHFVYFNVSVKVKCLVINRGTRSIVA